MGECRLWYFYFVTSSKPIIFLITIEHMAIILSMKFASSLHLVQKVESCLVVHGGTGYCWLHKLRCWISRTDSQTLLTN